MEVEVCMNSYCMDGSASREWKKGWPMRKGGFARLCYKCGSDYADSIFCNKFHQHQTGWRECSFCNKHIHCGCIVSRSLFEYLDFGGIGCVTCVKTSQLSLIRDTEIPNRSVRSIKNNASDPNIAHIDGRLLVDGEGKGKVIQKLCKIVEAGESHNWHQAERNGIDSYIGQSKQGNGGLSNLMKPCSHSLTFPTLVNNNRATWETKTMHKSSSLNNSVGTSSGNSILASGLDIVERRVEGKTTSCPFHQGQRFLPILPKPLVNDITMNMEISTGMVSQERVPRPPADGKGKNLLLSRYWPKITDQELEKLSGDLKSTIVPLFEKVLSASDAGRIGRIVLPKSCAEAYFPPISQSEGLPVQVKDMKGKEWTFQFRFWPNNNSRMYVLEGVTPCMQALQLNAGDIVTFSRIDPGGKFVMGFRKASNSTDTQDANTFAHPNAFSTKETTFSTKGTNLHSRNSYPNLFQTWKGKDEPYLNGSPEHLCLSTETTDSFQTENCHMVNNDLLQQPISISEKTQNIGPKSKRLLIDNEDAMELRLTWEEAQGILRPPPCVNPSIVTIDDKEFEEYEEPPIFGDGTTVNSHPSRSPSYALEKMSPKELEIISLTNKDSKRRKIAEKPYSSQEHEPFSLETVASLGILGGDDHSDSLAGANNSKDPRHRPGCICIVCIQPPSGKGKHKQTCTCLSCCMTARRQSNTIMMCKKQHQAELEADATQKDQIRHRDEGDTNGASRDGTSLLQKKKDHNKGGLKVVDELNAREIDLNSHPDDEDV